MRNRLEDELSHLSNYALCLTQNSEEARDLVQCTALKSLTARNIPDDNRAFRAWLFKILRNTFLDNVRKQANQEKILSELRGISEFEGNNQLGSDVYNIEQRKINILTVRQGLQRLNAGQREILILVDMAGFSYREVSDILQLPIGTVMSRISRSRNALLREMDGMITGPVSVSAAGKGK